MEFNGIVNKFFRKDQEARKRNLFIRTYVRFKKKKFFLRQNYTRFCKMLHLDCDATERRVRSSWMGEQHSRLATDLTETLQGTRNLIWKHEWLQSESNSTCRVSKRLLQDCILPFSECLDVKNVIFLISLKVHTFKTKLLARAPEIFSEWFLRTFPDPTSW